MFRKESIIYGIPIKRKNNLDMGRSQTMTTDELLSNKSKVSSSSWTDKIILNEDMQFVGVFALIIILSSLISTLWAAYFACFGPPKAEGVRVTDFILEVFFALDIIRNFLMQYVDPEEQKVIKSLKLIAKRYLKGRFVLDILAISPNILRIVVEDTWSPDKADLLFLLRLFRLNKLAYLVDTQKFQQIIKRIYSRSLEKAIRNN